MRIMTFNVRGALYEDGLNHWRHRAALNIQTILHGAPDLIGLQEPHQANLDVYRQQLAGYAIENGTPYNNSEPYQFSAIGWNTRTLRLLETGGFWLSDTPEVHSRAWDTAYIRSATWVRFEWLATGLQFLHLNTHLDNISEQARHNGARLIVQRLAQLAGERLPVVVTGDFNCLPGSAAYRTFQEAGFVDAYLAAGGISPINSFHNFQGAEYITTPNNFDRIDWILLRAWDGVARLQSCELIRDAEPPVYPSDHYPILAELAWA